MKYLDEYRDARRARQLVRAIRERATRRWKLMEVCGGQTHSLVRHGIVDELADVIELIHGPGCPVCVTALSAIDLAIELAHRPGVTVVSFGDMLRVPGSRESLAQARRPRRICANRLLAVGRCRRSASPQRGAHCFFRRRLRDDGAIHGAGREASGATRPGEFQLIGIARSRAASDGSLAGTPCLRHRRFSGAGHVCTITGFHSYDHLVAKHGIPVVVTGFEPVDLLAGILECVDLLESRQADVRNCYCAAYAAKEMHLPKD